MYSDFDHYIFKWNVYGVAYGCEVNISLNFKIWIFDSVYFDIGELVTSKFKKKHLVEIVLEYIHACCYIRASISP